MYGMDAPKQIQAALLVLLFQRFLYVYFLQVFSREMYEGDDPSMMADAVVFRVGEAMKTKLDVSCDKP